MGESTCLMHSLPEPNNHGNHVHVLGDSVSFGRFTSESLAWEKWSTFSHKRYVEEAKSYAQPGSVAQKKAFFEAHYKKVAAQKAAAAAAALLEQEKNAIATTTSSPKPHDYSQTSLVNIHIPQPPLLNTVKIVKEEQPLNLVESGTEKVVVDVGLKKKDLVNRIENLEDHVSVSEDSRTSQMDRPLLKSKSNTDQEVLQPRMRRKPATPSFRSTLVNKKQAKIPPSPSKYVAFMNPRKENNIITPKSKNSISTTMDSVDKKRIAPRSLYTLMNSGSVKESQSCKLNSQNVQKNETKKPVPSAHSTPKRYPTPARTPSKVKSGVNKQPLATPSVKRRVETQTPSAVGSKTPSQKWHIFSAVSKSLNAYRNKLQSPTKLEEKFNEKEAQKVQLQTSLKEKAETEFRRLRQTFCFKARPLPSFYNNERETPKSMIKRTPQAQGNLNLRSVNVTPTRKPPTTTMVSSQPCSIKKSSRRLWKNNNDQNPINHPLSELARRISHENMSPNIQ
uniref:TPX2 C-terminal domain-containing protein n=1 Tax=Lactuca sativa TaxID=4236 RepID=A0A9R1XFG5_LACSA|nr:hypothetical protein LSAT_V11C400227770 [Lactuca sativa]